MSTHDHTSLHATIREVARTEDLDDPRAIAEKVAANTSNDVIREHYITALTSTVRDVLRAERADAFNMKPAKPARSAKLKQRRSWWSDFIAARVAVAGEWKKLGDCSGADLATIEYERRENAARSIAVAEQYALLRDLLESHGVATVAALPPKAVEDALGRAAA